MEMPGESPHTLANRSAGVFAGEPMPTYSVQLPIWGVHDQRGPHLDDSPDWFNRWVRPLIQQ